MSDFGNGYAGSNGGPPVAGRFEGSAAERPRRGRRALLALVLVASMLGSAFGLGIGVMRAVDGEEPAQSLRSPRGVSAVPAARIAEDRPAAGQPSSEASIYDILDEVHRAARPAAEEFHMHAAAASTRLPRRADPANIGAGSR